MEDGASKHAGKAVSDGSGDAASLFIRRNLKPMNTFYFQQKYPMDGMV
jgi:hypothetical protein